MSTVKHQARLQHRALCTKITTKCTELSKNSGRFHKAQSSVHKNHEQLNAQSFLKIPAGSTKHRAPFKFGQPHNTQSFAKPGKNPATQALCCKIPLGQVPRTELCATSNTQSLPQVLADFIMHRALCRICISF